MSDHRLTMADIRKAGFCVKDSVLHAQRLGLDHRELILKGLPIADVEHIEDANLQKSLVKARERIAKGG